MRRFATVILALAVLPFLASCGGGGTPKSATAKIQIFPSPVTINQGQVMQLTAEALDSSGALVTPQPTFTFNLANNGGGAISISSVLSGSVQLCAGSWDASFINCTPGPANSQGMVTASGGGFTSDPDQVFVHATVGRVTIQPVPPGCTVTGATLQLTAKVFDLSGNDITAAVGPLTWTSSVVAIATVDTNGLVTAVVPGHSNIIASVSGVVSVPFDFGVCLVQSIALTASNQTIAPNGTQQFNSTVVDQQNNTITTPTTLIYNVVPGAVGNGASTGVVTGLTPGTAVVIASCTPQTCNAGNFPDLFFPVYSNPLILTVTGTTATTTYAGTVQAPPSGTAPTLLPIATSNNTAGAAITLTNPPNSMIPAPNGGKIYLGSNGGMMVVDGTSNSVVTVNNLPGTVISVSQDSANTVVAFGNIATFINNNSGVLTPFNLLAPPTKASWSPDSYEAYVLAGSNVFVISTRFPTKQIALGATGNDVVFLNAGPFAYAAAGTDIKTFRTCDSSLVDSKTFNAPMLIATLPDSSKIVAADTNGNLDILAPTVTTPTGVNANPCTAITVSNTASTATLSGTAFTPKQIIVTPDSAYVFVLPAGSAQIFRYKVADGSVVPIALAGACTEPTSGGATLDSSKLYVGCSGSNDVHVIDVVGGTDTGQIATSFKKSDNSPAPPDLVAVRTH